MAYKLHLLNGYPIVDVDGRLFLIDTGAPSTSFSGQPSITIEGKSFLLRQYPMPKEIMLMAYGRTIDGYIGNDILEAFGGFEVNKVEGEVAFGKTESERAYSSKIDPQGFSDIVVNGKLVKAFLDTGASRLMFNKGKLAVKNDDCMGPWDEPTNYGIMPTVRYHGTLTFAGKTAGIEMLEMSRPYPYDYFFGLNDLADSYYGIDYKNGEVYFC